jgi:hypothetical protein
MTKKSEFEHKIQKIEEDNTDLEMEVNQLKTLESEVVKLRQKIQAIEDKSE